MIKSYGDFGIKDFINHEFLSSYKKIYIPNEVLKNGDLTIHIKSVAQNAIFYVLEKSGLNFTVLKAKRVNLNDGENIVDMEYSTSGNGSEYFGYYARGYYKITGGKGFYETGSEDTTYDYVSGQTIITTDNTIGTPSVFDLGAYPEYQTKIKDEISKLNTEFAQLNDDFNSLPSLTSQPSINLTDYKTPQYSEISEPVGFVGRWFDKTINGFACKVTINQGSEFYFKVKGTTSINVNFELNSALETPYFAYSIDGSPMTRQLITNPTLLAVTTDEHIVRVVIDGITETEDKWVGEKGVAFKNVTVGVGGTITGVLPKNRKIMFFGDSITEGVRVLNMEATANGNSGSGAYPFVTCENLNAISYRVGFGAQGVTNGGSGGVPEVLPMLDLMTSTRPAPYYEPDLIVLNHGTNDGPGTSEDFIAKYNAV
ncbi:SGNH/GDSL hydrolase family protein [Aerococcus sp. 1KP-2016]|uniref:SGNH/GDSL hydrolase family protein n=1 Tax=Aerococcus sp. 1KP-2016 TaxID=1981982 RepID=UPI000B98D518|nr:SGNH/GDSL hydrolase family protein [Aerococcus sp. 1KP-2016]OYQ67918.1 hypothetical protein B9P78_02120 [Aerococcus sp. 1KP-2016]